MCRGGGASGPSGEDGSLGVPLFAVLGSLHPVFVGGVAADEGVFETGQVTPTFGVSISFRILLLLPPPTDVSELSDGFGPSGLGESS